jgi:TonB family protein
MVKIGIISLLLVPAIALAQQVPAPPAAGSATAGAPQFTNGCAHFYPASADQSGEEGATLVSIHVAADGIVAEPRVAVSSGHADLDSAALTCVSGAHIAPIKSNGVAIAAETEMQVTWKRSFFGGAPASISTNCHGWYPAEAVRHNHEGETLLAFTAGADGSIKNISVAKSSGYDELDQAAITCASAFRYRPVTLPDGTRVDVDMKTNIIWRLR